MSIMKDQKENVPPDEKIALVDEWVVEFSRSNELKEIDRGFLRDVLEVYGARWEMVESKRESLGKYTNKGRAPAMRIIWGDRFEEYKKWTREYVSSYEEKTGSTLPALKPSGIKTSGMIQFFGEITALAGLTENELPFQLIRQKLETRARNGRAWVEGRKQDRVRIRVPKSEKPILLSSFPPEFPNKAWEKIKSWKE